jgi:hypothetical protein
MTLSFMQVRLLKNMPPFKFRRIGIDQISETIKGTGSCLSGGHPTAPLPTSCCVTSADLFDVRARPPLRLPQRSARSSRSCGHLRRGVRWQNRPICQKRSDHTRFGLHFMSWVPSVRFQPLGNVPGALVQFMPRLAATATQSGPHLDSSLHRHGVTAFVALAGCQSG